MKKMIKTVAFAFCLAIGMNSIVVNDVKALEVPANVQKAGALIMKNGSKVLNAIAAKSDKRMGKLSKVPQLKTIGTAINGTLNKVTCKKAPALALWAAVLGGPGMISDSTEDCKDVVKAISSDWKTKVLLAEAFQKKVKSAVKDYKKAKKKAKKLKKKISKGNKLDVKALMKEFKTAVPIFG